MIRGPVRVKSYKVLINYEAGSMQQELVREMGPTMPRGGGVPFTGELRQVTAVSADHAWNVPIAANPLPARRPPHAARFLKLEAPVLQVRRRTAKFCAG